MHSFAPLQSQKFSNFSSNVLMKFRKKLPFFQSAERWSKNRSPAIKETSKYCMTESEEVKERGAGAGMRDAALKNGPFKID